MPEPVLTKWAKFEFMRRWIVVLVTLTVALLACRKDPESLPPTPPHGTMMFSIGPDWCADTARPINCYLRPPVPNKDIHPLNPADTLLLPEGNCLFLGHCAPDTFIPHYKLCLPGFLDNRIPDTAMCRRVGLPLCCPDPTNFLVEFTDVIISIYGVDAAQATFQVTPLCPALPSQKHKLILWGKYTTLPHSDYSSTPCSTYVQQWWWLDISDSFQVQNCTIELLDLLPGPDTVTMTLLSGPYIDSCCTGISKQRTPADRKTQIRIHCR